MQRSVGCHRLRKAKEPSYTLLLAVTNTEREREREIVASCHKYTDLGVSQTGGSQSYLL